MVNLEEGGCPFEVKTSLLFFTQFLVLSKSKVTKSATGELEGVDGRLN